MKIKNLLIKVWSAITLVLGVVVYVLFTKYSNEKMKNAVDQIKKEAKKEWETAEKLKQNIKNRKRKDEKLSNKMKGFFNTFLALILAISIWISPALSSGKELSANFSVENLKVPKDYDILLEYYKQMALIAVEYQHLYREAEADNERLAESNNRLQKLIEKQQEIIDSLLKQAKGNLGVFTGINYMPTEHWKPGLIVGINYQF